MNSSEIYSLFAQSEPPHEDHVGHKPHDVIETSAQKRERNTSSNIQHYPLQPNWLSVSTLCGFVAFYGAPIAALEVLYYFSRRNNGLVKVTNERHMLWTYGPTACKPNI